MHWQRIGKPILDRRFLFLPSKNTKKYLVFCFYGAQQSNIGLKWVNKIIILLYFHTLFKRHFYWIWIYGSSLNYLRTKPFNLVGWLKGCSCGFLFVPCNFSLVFTTHNGVVTIALKQPKMGSLKALNSGKTKLPLIQFKPFVKSYLNIHFFRYLFSLLYTKGRQ